MLNNLLSILESRNLFLTGGAGAGKSYTINEIIQHYKKNNKFVISLGSTGVSAVAIGGMTIHSFFKFGICKDQNELALLDKKQSSALKQLKEILKKTDLIVIDEISMVSSEIFDLIYYRISSLRCNAKIIVVGDFYQLPPVVKNNEFKKDLFIKSKYAFGSYGWEMFNFKYVEILGSKRCDDEDFNSILCDLRVGVINKKLIYFLNSHLCSLENISDSDTILFSTNNEVDNLNYSRLNLIPSKIISSFGEVKIFDEKINQIKLEKWILNLNVNPKFDFKIGAKVMFSINKWGEFYNGESGVIVDFLEQDDKVIKIYVKKQNGVICEVSRYSYNLEEIIIQDGQPKESILASYEQFPLKLAYAITIHKSQGMSIKNLVCDVSNIFENAQFYVALSRGVSSKNIKIVFRKNTNFLNYLKNTIRIDNEIRKFYNENEFLRLNS